MVFDAIRTRKYASSDVAFRLYLNQDASCAIENVELWIILVL